MSKDDHIEEKSPDRYKRDRETEESLLSSREDLASNANSNSTSNPNSRPSKIPKLELDKKKKQEELDNDNDNDDDDDPVAQARRALEMFRKEVEGDEDMQDSQGTDDNENNVDIKDEVVKESINNGDKKETNGKEKEINGGEHNAASLRWQKINRKPIISLQDDPGLL